MRDLTLGPDSARYILAGQGQPVARPFNLRWLLPAVCGDDPRMWWAVWFTSWPVAAAGMVWWLIEADATVWQGLAAAALVVALAGVWAPHVCRPVSVDLPAMALSIVAVAALEAGWWPLAVALVIAAGATKETAPVFAAVWAWNPVMLIGLAAPAVIAVFNRPELDQFTSQGVLRHVHDHPVKSAWEHHRGKWRDPRMVTQWGACLAALYAPNIRVAVVLAVAYLQLVVATDVYRLVHTAAGPLLAFYAVQTIPDAWLPLAVAASVVFLLPPETQ